MAKHHYVPEWYQQRFIAQDERELYRLFLKPREVPVSGGLLKQLPNPPKRKAPGALFFERDLYTTRFFGHANSDIETHLFGKIDSDGAVIVKALVENDERILFPNFLSLFDFIDAQKLRTPKGLDWLRTRFPYVTGSELLIQMQQVRRAHCTMWVEAAREIVSADESSIKFIISDHPVTIYNPACFPGSPQCQYPLDPPITLKGSQTIFPLDLNRCLIFTNLEYAENPALSKRQLLTQRTNARYFDTTIARADAFVRTHNLTDGEVATINYIIKRRAHQYVAGPNAESLYPEKHIGTTHWSKLANLLIPRDEMWRFGGEIFVRHKDGSIDAQDKFGRRPRTATEQQKAENEMMRMQEVVEEALAKHRAERRQ